MHNANRIARTPNVGRLALAVALALLVPLVAMAFTDGVAWGPADFVIAGALLFGAAYLVEMALLAGGSMEYRLAAAVAVIGALLLVWVSMAVGIIRSEDHPANLMYLAVLGVGVVGAVAVRVRAAGMARVLAAMAVTHAVVTVAALFLGDVRTFVLNVFFIALWSACAWLFSRSAHGRGN